MFEIPGMQEPTVLPEIDPRFNPLRTLDDSQSINVYEGDNKLFIKFLTKAVMNPLASTKAGRPVFDEEDYIEIRIPGSQLTCVSAPMTDFNYMQRFGVQYRKWKEGQVEMLSGTPIDSFPYLLGKVAQLAELKAMNIQTVEQLASLDDSWKQKIMGGQELSRRAAEWINKTSGTDAQVATMAKENEQLKAQMEMMQKQMAELMAATKPAEVAPDGAPDANTPAFLKTKK